MNYDKTKLDETQLNYLAEAEKLQKEMIFQGFLATRIEKDEEDRCTFKVIFFDGNHEYRIMRDYHQNVTLTRNKHEFYPNVSSSVRSNTWKKYETNNMKVLSKSKIQTKIDMVNLYHEEMEKLEGEALKKKLAFIQTLVELEKEGIKVAYTRRNGEIEGGYIDRNGLIFQFEIGQDGYVSKKITLQYSAGSDLDTFMALSNNEYKKNSN